MTFISYAQNSEDVLLWRALGHIKNGYYIDVGANDPVEHSVTKAFYDAGWSGISIEPLPSFHQAFIEQRPRDVNLAIAAGATDGELLLYDVPAVRGWASPELEVAKAHEAEGYEVAELKVPVKTLASVCAEHVRGDIHFLKIDVEGFEGEVLRGMDFTRWRPWVLVIEATLPGSRETNHETWEPLVLTQGYRFAWFDGLNRYYVADEHPELMDAFGIQPNVFDAFISHHLDKAWAANATLNQQFAQSETQRHAAEQRADRSEATAHQAVEHARDLLARYDQANQRAEGLHSSLEALKQQFDQLRDNAERTHAWAQELEQRVLAMQASTSWRLTRPVRVAGRSVRALLRPGLLRRLALRVTASERLRRLLIPVLLRFPALRRRVSALLAAAKEVQAAPLPPALAAIPEELRALPVSVRGVLADLRRARGDNHRS
jgi:FkbM family methyltransferase